MSLGILFVASAGLAAWAMGVGRLKVEVYLAPPSPAFIAPHGWDDIFTGVVAVFVVLLVVVGGVGTLAWWTYRAVQARRRRSGPWG